MGHLVNNRNHRRVTITEPVTEDISWNTEPLLIIRFLRTFKEVLKFVLFSYTVLFGGLLIARWTTYCVVGMRKWGL